MPMASWFSGKGSLSRIEEKQAYHLPFSFLRVSVLTSPLSERCNLILTLPILDKDSCPPFTPNPACGYVNESYQPWPLKRGNPRPRRKNAWYVLSTRCSTSCSTCEYTLPSAGSAALQAGNCADCMEKDTQVRHNFQASRRSLRASLYNWRHTSSVENKTFRSEIPGRAERMPGTSYLHGAVHLAAPANTPCPVQGRLPCRRATAPIAWRKIRRCGTTSKPRAAL